MFPSLHKRQVAVSRQSKPILDVWIEDCKGHIPALKLACEALWQDCIPQLGQALDMPRLQPFLDLLKPFMKLCSAEGRESLNALDIGAELELLSTILTGAVPAARDNASLLRQCVDGFFEFNTNFLDIPWSDTDSILSAKEKIHRLTIREDTFDKHEALIHRDVSLMSKLKELFDTIDPTLKRTQYLVAGSQEETAVQKAFQRFQNEFYVWAAEYVNKNPHIEQVSSEKILQKLADMVDTMKEDMGQCETAQKNTCAEAASRLLLDQSGNSIQITLALSTLTVIELRVQYFLANHIKNTNAARDQHTVCFAMNIVREAMGLSLVDDKYPIQFEGVKETILANKKELLSTAKEGVSFGAISDLVCTHLDVSMLSKELVDDDGVNPDLALMLFEDAPKSHQIKNDWATFHVLIPFFLEVSQFSPLQASAIYGLIAQQEPHVAASLLSAAAWTGHPGIAANQGPADRMKALLTHAGIHVREFAVMHESLWLLPNAIDDMFDASFLIQIMHQKKPQIIEWLETTHRDRFVALCISNRNIFLKAIQSGDPAIFGLVKKSLSTSGISFPEVFIGTAPLHMAIIGGSADILEVLVRECRFNPMQRNQLNQSLLALAVNTKQTSMIRALRRIVGEGLLDSEIVLLSQEIQNRNKATVQALIEPIEDTQTVAHVLHHLYHFLSNPSFGEFILDALAEAIKRESRNSAEAFVTTCNGIFSNIPNREQKQRLYEKILLLVPSLQVSHLLVAHLETLEDLNDYCSFVKKCSYDPLIAAQFTIRRNAILETKYKDQCPLNVPHIMFNKIEDKINSIHQLYDAVFSFFASAGSGHEGYRAWFQAEYAQNLGINKKALNPHICMPMFQTALFSQLTKKPHLIETLSLNIDALIQGVIDRAFEIQPQTTYVHASTAKELCEFLKKISGLVTNNNVISVANQLLKSGKESRPTVLGYFQALLHKVSHTIDRETLMTLGAALIAYQTNHTYQDLGLLPVFIELLNTSGTKDGLTLDAFAQLRVFTNTVFTESTGTRKGPDLDLRYEGLVALYTHATDIPEAVEEDVQRCLACTRSDRYKWVSKIIARMPSKNRVLEATYNNIISRKVSEKDMEYNLPAPLLRQLLGWIRQHENMAAFTKADALLRAYRNSFSSLQDSVQNVEADAFVSENIAQFPDLLPFLIATECANSSQKIMAYMSHRRNTLMSIPNTGLRIYALKSFYVAVLPLLEKIDPDCHLLIHEIRFQMAALKDIGGPQLGVEVVLNGCLTGRHNPYSELASKCHVFLSLAEDIGDRDSLQSLTQHLQIETAFYGKADTIDGVSDLKTRLTYPNLMDVKSMLTLTRLSRMGAVDFPTRDGLENEIIAADYLSETSKHQLLSWIPLPATQADRTVFLSECPSPRVLAGRIHAISRRHSGSANPDLIAAINDSMYHVAASSLTEVLKEVVFASFFQLYDPETLCVLIQEKVRNPRFNTAQQAVERLGMYRALGWHQKMSHSSFVYTRISALMQEESESILGSPYSDTEKARLIAWTYALSPAVMNFPKTIKYGPLTKIQRQSRQADRLLHAALIATKGAFPWLNPVSISVLHTHLAPFCDTPQKKQTLATVKAQLMAALDLKKTNFSVPEDRAKARSWMYQNLFGFLSPGYAVSKLTDVSIGLRQCVQNEQPSSSDTFQSFDRRILSFSYTALFLIDPRQWNSLFLQTTKAVSVTESECIRLATSYDAIARANSLFGGFFSGGVTFLPVILREFNALNTLDSPFKEQLLGVFSKCFKTFLPATAAAAESTEDRDGRDIKRQRREETL